jgi:hypothetical protein
LALLGDLGGHCSLTEIQFRGYIKSNMVVSEPIVLDTDAFLDTSSQYDNQQSVCDWLDDRRTEFQQHIRDQHFWRTPIPNYTSGHTSWPHIIFSYGLQSKHAQLYGLRPSFASVFAHRHGFCLGSDGVERHYQQEYCSC